jgi:anthrone oxygenase-like protein
MHIRAGGALVAIFQFIAVLATTLFTGAAVYINVAEHPARMECGTALAATVFGPSYSRAAVMQAGLALVATTGAIGAWLMGAAVTWLIGALLIFAVVPFTLLVMLPANKRLLDPAIDRTSETVQVLLQHWGKLHAVRSALALAASILLVASLLFSPPKP